MYEKSIRSRSLRAICIFIEIVELMAYNELYLSIEINLYSIIIQIVVKFDKNMFVMVAPRILTPSPT